MSTKPTTAVAFRLLASREQLTGSTGDCLENVDVGSIDDGALCWVLSPSRQLYALDKTSVAAVSPPNVIATLAGAGVPGRWEKYPAAAPGGLVPLTREIYVDPGRVGSTEDGSIGNPYLTGQAAFNVVNADESTERWAVILAPGNYEAEDLVLTPNAFDVTVRCEGRGTAVKSLTIDSGFNVLLEDLTVLEILNANCALRMRNVLVQGGITGNARLYFETCGPIQAVALDPGAGARAIVAADTSFVSLAEFETADLSNCIVDGDCASAVLGASARIVDTLVGGALRSEILELVSSKVNGVVTSDALRADSYSLSYLRDIGNANVVGATVNSDLKLVTDVVFAVPVLVAAMADVAVVVPGCKVGDTFAIVMTTRLAGVGIVGCWASDVAELTVRFSGTTAGGNVTCSVSIIPNTP